MKKVLITGASGVVAGEALKQIAQTERFVCKVFLRPKAANRKLAKQLTRKYKNIEICFGDLINPEDCQKAVSDVQYVLHLAGVIPPLADYYPDSAYASNFLGTKNLVSAAEAVSPSVKFVYFGSVAEYGNRTFKHPWGRVGDPLLPSCLDIYGTTKVRAEREVIESSLTWVSLRESGVLYDDILMKNMSDGIMFHTPWNTPIEWATARTSGLLLKNLLEFDVDGVLPFEFWHNVYNIGNGADSRVTGFETLEAGFNLMGRGVKDIFEPHWASYRNFHCMWFEDSKVLESFLHFQKAGIDESFADFFDNLGKKLWYFKLGKPFPKAIKKFAIMPVLKTENAPKFWIDSDMQERITAFFISKEHLQKMPTDWKDFYLLHENKNPETGEFLDYRELKDEANVAKFRLSHGYDESKNMSAINISDMKDAAYFRGGKCLSRDMKQGELYTPLEWECHNGHKFYSKPFTVLKAGFWCPHCCTAPPWNVDELAKHIPFYSQIWYDDHDMSESNFYSENSAKGLNKK
ncbi:MAG: epimerase [Treponema sp.]|nr:MAG: epimerase [Treponema sp.]